MLTLEVVDQEINNIIQHGTNYTDCSRLADLYICRAGMTGGLPDMRSVSALSLPVPDRDSSEFLKSACKSGKCWEVLDELMMVLQSINPRLYAGVIRKLQETEEG